MATTRKKPQKAAEEVVHVPELVPPPELVRVEPVTAKVVETRQNNRMMELEDQVLEKNLVILDGAARFHEIDPELEEPPKAWVLELGREKALERLRLAKYALLPAGAAPVGLKMAPAVVSGILKAKAARDTGPKLTLNAMLFQIPIAELPVYPTKRLPPRTESG